MNLNVEFMKKTFVLALHGVPETLKITVVALLVSLVFGSIFAIVKIYKVRVLTQLINIYVSIMRGTPIVLQILIVYSLFPSILNSIIQKLGLGIKIWDINNIIYAYIVFSLSTTAGLTETIRSALLSIDKVQMEAALSIGLSPFQAYRRIIIPQAFEAALPNICTTTINLVKATSLAFMMSVKEVTSIAKTEASFGYDYVEAYLDIFVIYLIVCMAIQGIFKVIELRAKNHRKVSHA